MTPAWTSLLVPERRLDPDQWPEELLDERELWVSRRDQHPNARGHHVAAEALSPYLHKVLVEAGTSANDP